MLHLAGYSGHYKVVEEILSAGTLKYPINLFARNGEMKTARNCSKGNMAIAKILRKAENKYIKEIFESQQITEMQLLANHVQSRKIHFINKITENDMKRHQDLLDSGYQSLLDQLRVVKYQLMYTLGGKKFAHTAPKKPVHQKPRGADPLKLRLDQSRIYDPESSDHPEDASDEENHPGISNGVGKRVFGSI